MNDRYTKAVLTVIAAALCALVAQNAIGPLGAAGRQFPQQVVICDVKGDKCAEVYEPTGYSEHMYEGMLSVHSK